MKRILPIVVVAVVAVSISVWAQGRRGAAPPAPPAPLEAGASQADVDKALIAAPAALSNQATVIRVEVRFRMRHVEERHQRPGLLRPVGLSASTGVRRPVHESRQSGARGAEPESGGVSRSRQVGGDARGDGAGRHAREAEFGSIWYHVSGPDRDHPSAHEVTIAVPGATQASLGLPDQRRENGAWIMNAGTSTAHIMIRDGDRAACAGVLASPGAATSCAVGLKELGTRHANIDRRSRRPHPVDPLRGCLRQRER